MQERKEQAKVEVAKLVDKFHGLTPAQVRAYNEEDTKKDFIMPLFQALGWNVNEKEEVAAEVRVTNRRVDYAFKLQGVPRFYLEAKPLGNDLIGQEQARQAVTYAYHKGITWALLCNFAHLRVFHANVSIENPQAGILLTLAAEDYIARFDELWDLSKVGMQGRQLEARNKARMPERLPVEKRLYSQLTKWREGLFNSIANWQANLTSAQVDEIVQRLLNRLIFIRTCEDKGLEDPRLRATWNQYQDGRLRGDQKLLEEVQHILKYYAEVYDSDLFHQNPLDIVNIHDDDLLAGILSGLHRIPDTWAEYDFSLIDADILGAVYEQYLGHVAQVTLRRQRDAQQRMQLGLPGETTYEITEKRQRRKEQGIYYTPLWVTDYIVRQTVGRFIEEHKNRPDAIHDMKILDMACGSGSFLIRAYDELLKWGANSAGIPLDRMTQEFRMPLLKNNIFGVDLDPQAIEIARLNLLLRALAQRKLLPSLADNVVRGNSLISGTEAELRPYFGDGWEDKRPFNWEQEFPEIMADGGFDIVIGNPPYAGFQGFDEDKPYLRNQYQCAKGRFDIYMPFIEKGLSLLREGGVLGFICPTNFMKRQHGAELREALKGHTTIEALMDFEHTQVFEEAINYTCVLLLRKAEPTETHKIRYWPGGLESKPYEIEQSKLRKEGWRFATPNETKLFSKLSVGEVAPLGQLVQGIYEGIVTGANAVFLLPKTLAGRLDLEQSLVKPAIRGKEIERWIADEPSHVLIYPYLEAAGKSNVIPENVLETGYPNVYQYLKEKRPNLGGRPYFNRSRKNWYELWNERSFDKQQVTKIVVQEVAPSAKFALSSEGQFYLDTVCGLVLKDQARNNMLYILGLLNSKLLDFNYKRITVPKASGFYIYKTMFLQQLPIRRIDFSDATDKEMHHGLVALVERMLALQERLKPVRGTGLTEEHDLLREVERIDSDIDNLVYDLYGLTEAERRLVEAV